MLLSLSVGAQVAFEAQALRQRLLEDRLAAEVQAAEQTEALAICLSFTSNLQKHARYIS